MKSYTEELLMVEPRYASKQNKAPKHAAGHSRSEHARVANGEDALFNTPLSEVRYGQAPVSDASRFSRSSHPISSGVSTGELLRGAGTLTHAVNPQAWRRGAMLAVAVLVLVVACTFVWNRALPSGQSSDDAQAQAVEQADEESSAVQEVSQAQEQADVMPGQAPDNQQDFARYRQDALGFMEQGDMPHSPRADFMQEAGFANLTGISANVPALYQYPSMPAGCEVYSLTAVLTALGVDADPDDIVATYLPFDATDDDYATAFWGDPYSSGEGMPPAIMLTGNAVLQDADTTRRFENATGARFDDLANLANSGSPVLVWTTLSFEDPQFDEPLEANSFYYLEHCVVLLGTQGDDVCLMDPTQGYVTVSYSWFKYLYEQCGSMALKLA